jgi:type I restriction enzyme M protein
VVHLLAEMIEPFHGVLYDPCCGSGGMFIQSERMLRQRDGQTPDLRCVGQESNRTTWRLARMNIALHGLSADLGAREGDTFLDDLHHDLKVDFVLSNPPFNAKDWGGDRLRNDVRWRFGAPPVGNANYAWLQHILHHLDDHGLAAVVLSNGALSSDQSGEGEIRRALVDAGVVDCVVSLPPQLFFTTTIPVSVWCLAKSRDHGARARRGGVLFIHANDHGRLVDRTHRVLDDEEIDRIAATYRRWRGASLDSPYRDEPGFCRAATLEEVRRHRYALVPGRYVGFAEPGPPEAVFARVSAEIEAAERALDRIGDATGVARDLLQALREGVVHG